MSDEDLAFTGDDRVQQTLDALHQTRALEGHDGEAERSLLEAVCDTLFEMSDFSMPRLWDHFRGAPQEVFPDNDMEQVLAQVDGSKISLGAFVSLTRSAWSCRKQIPSWERVCDMMLSEMIKRGENDERIHGLMMGLLRPSHLEVLRKRPGQRNYWESYAKRYRIELEEV